MKLSNKPRHYAPHKKRHGVLSMPNSKSPGHKSLGGSNAGFKTFEEALAFIVAGTSRLFTRRKESLTK